MSQNPLLQNSKLPLFSKITAADIEPAIDEILKINIKKIAELKSLTEITWDIFAQPLEELSIALENVWSVVSHLNNVTSTEDIRKAYNACLPKLTDYETELGQSLELYERYKSLSESHEFLTLSQAQKKIIRDAIRDFQLNGVHLPQEQKDQLKKIDEELAQLQTKFEENLMDATDFWKLEILDENKLAGIPEHTINAAKENAKKQNKDGWLLSLEFPCYYAVITYADDRELRKEIYTAYATRASELGFDTGKFDNSKIMEEILSLREQEAKILGFNNFAELSLATKMAKTSKQVLDFLNTLAEKSFPIAQTEIQTLKSFAKDQHQIEELFPWDVPYYSEKLQAAQFQITQEQLRPYFPEDRVLQGLFTIIEKLYGVKVQLSDKKIETWHKDVRFYEVFDKQHHLIGGFYCDLYARPQKRGGAWMDSCRTRYRDHQNQLHLPVVFLTCNFSGSTENSPALFTHDEVVTLFHEFGHGLHQLLTKVEDPSVSGIHGVEWDAVELPSQFMENFCWEMETIKLFSSHYITKETLSDELFIRLYKTKNFQSGMQMVRQLEFALFDFRLHIEFNNSPGQIKKILDEVRAKISVVPIAPFNRFAHSFSHIFAGGYAAGYYSYKWAEVLACDAFAKFEEKGIFNPDVGQSFLNNILEKGGSDEAMNLFVAFMGREPSIDALLKHSGIV